MIISFGNFLILSFRFQIRNIIFSRRCDFVITNSADRIIRAYDLNDILKKQFGLHIEPVHKVSDIVNKVASFLVTTWSVWPAFFVLISSFIILSVSDLSV